MLTLKEINDLASVAINDAFDHYFTNLTSGQDLIDEGSFIALLFQETPPWLMFTEEGLEGILVGKVNKSPAHIALIHNLTAVFHNYFTVEEEEYSRYLQHLARSYHTNAGAANLNMMLEEHYNRMIDVAAIRLILENNRIIVMLATMFTHLNTGLISAAMSRVPK